MHLYVVTYSPNGIGQTSRTVMAETLPDAIAKLKAGIYERSGAPFDDGQIVSVVRGEQVDYA